MNWKTVLSMFGALATLGLVIIAATGPEPWRAIPFAILFGLFCAASIAHLYEHRFLKSRPDR
jgi:hypothetical protein